MENVFLSDAEIINIFKNHLKIESRVISIEDLFNLRNNNVIDFKPYYQRKYVWNDEKATYFIESILLGTEIPPLIFFYSNNNKIEIIDGRQRYETMKNFLDNKLTLNNKGLLIFKNLNKNSISKLNQEFLDRFLNSKIRIIDFKLINEPKLDLNKEDKIKKEIFRRYNSGITPLRRSDVDKAVFIEDPITNILKDKFKRDNQFYNKNIELFFPKRKNTISKSLLEELISKIRLLTVLHLIPIKYYSTLSNRKDIINLLYRKFSDELDRGELFLADFEKKIAYLDRIKNVVPKYNQLMSECFLWAFNVLENEGFSLKEVLADEFLTELSNKITDHLEIYSEENSHFYKEFNQRHKFSLELFENRVNKNFKNYLDTYDVKEIRENIDLEKENFKPDLLVNRFLTRPAPTDITVDSIKKKMQKNNFKVRPIYQRNEVMNINKSSSLIESILLDIKLPPIFVYKNLNSVYEVIDGQQRILAILGFIGEKYKDESGELVFSNKNEFKLRNLTILKELNGKAFSELNENYQNKILDFNLSVVEIDQEINTHFNPIDLFIRLNSKPYPIRDNTFEMWNSYADIDIIKKIKDDSKKIDNWFYIKKSKNNKRMENEELYTTLVYIDFMNTYKKMPLDKIIDFHKRKDRINCRISDKKEVSKILNLSSTNEDEKKNFLNSIKNIEQFTTKVKTILIQTDIDPINLNLHLDIELDKLFGLKSRRRLHNFYFLYSIIKDINLNMIRENRHEIFKNIEDIYNQIANIPSTENENHYFKMVENLNNSFIISSRKLILTDSEKKNLLIKQKNICPICKFQLYFGEDTEVDHIIPISKGGLDATSNLQLVHKNCNRKKSSIILNVINKTEDDINVYLSKLEDENLEFKSTLWWNIIGKIKDKKIEEEVLKTICAFNNSSGGILIIGVEDNRNVLGLELDYSYAQLINADKFQQHLNNIIFDRLVCNGGRGYLTKNIKISFEKVKDKDVCIVKIAKGTVPIYTKEGNFFIRTGNSTTKLEINEVVEYVKNSFEY